MVSSGFAMDLCLERDELHTRHIVQAVGSSSIEKAKSFVAQRCPSQKPNLYDTYQGVYDDPDVDAVYIGTPHTLHLRNALDAIAAGKHVLCEKPFAMNAKEAQTIFDAAEKKGVFVMEGGYMINQESIFYSQSCSCLVPILSYYEEITVSLTQRKGHRRCQDRIR